MFTLTIVMLMRKHTRLSLTSINNRMSSNRSMENGKRLSFCLVVFFCQMKIKNLIINSIFYFLF